MGRSAPSDATDRTRLARVSARIRASDPGGFALVMATGIVSVAMADGHAYPISVALLWIGIVAYAALVIGHLWRVGAHSDAVRADLAHPRRAFGYFTFVAATNVIGARLAADGHRLPALVLLGVGAVAWLALGYLVPWTALLRRTRGPLLGEVDGTWFIWVVGAQSVAVLAADLEPLVTSGRRELALLAVFAWSVGAVGYAIVTMLMATRTVLHHLRPDDLTPAYWVSMGATAITVVAGASIVRMNPVPIGTAVHELIAGTSVVFWMFGTWLIPALVAAGIWRHLVHRVPLRYEPALWSVVFPLGMYGVGSHYLSAIDHLPILEAISTHEAWVALGAWLLTFAAMLVAAGRTLTSARRGRPPRTAGPARSG